MKASVTLEDKRTGTEYDLCPDCEQELIGILTEKKVIEDDDGRKRVFNSTKTAKR
jgi:uncharacterized protein with PIN domain